MSTLTKSDIKSFLLAKKGYIKKSPIKVAEALWRSSQKHVQPKNVAELTKELGQIKEVQSVLRVANTVKESQEDTTLSTLYEKILAEKNQPKKRLFFDLETSPNVVFAWRIGSKINIGHDSIINERAIICVSYKWEGDDTVYSIRWNKGDDKELCKKFAKIIDSADEILTQNGDKFDIKWLRTRCLFHGIPVSVKFNSIDTLKMARNGFYFNSNKLDYMAKFTGVGQKIKTEYDLWTRICLHNDQKAMDYMVEYCEEDVRVLERVYNKLQPFSPVKKFKYKIV